MRISSNFQGFMFAMLTDLYEQMVQRKRIIMSFNKFRNVLKYIDPNYPRDNNGDPVSYAKVSSKAFTMHIEFIIKWSGEYGITPSFVEEEFKRLMENAHE